MFFVLKSKTILQECVMEKAYNPSDFTESLCVLKLGSKGPILKIFSFSTASNFRPLSFFLNGFSNFDQRSV